MSTILRRPNPRIVIPIVAGIGNALLAVPMLRQLKRALPDSRILILARLRAMAQVFERLAEVDEIRLMSSVGARHASPSLQWALSMFRVQSELRPDLVLLPFPSNRWQYMMLALATGARNRLLHRYPVGMLGALGFIPADRIPAIRGIHDVVQNLNLLRMLGIEPDITEAPIFEVRDDDRRRAGELLLRAGLHADAHPIAIHPGSARTILATAKRWPPQMYAHLLLRLQQRFGNRIVILEGPDEAGVADEILAAAAPITAPVIRLTGPLADAAAILQQSMLYIGSDSGLAHLSAAVGTAPVTLFAPSDPDRACPFGYRHLVVQPENCPCAPCFLYPWRATKPSLACADAHCIRSITVEQVMRTVELASRRTALAPPNPWHRLPSLPACGSRAHPDPRTDAPCD